MLNARLLLAGHRVAYTELTWEELLALTSWLAIESGQVDDVIQAMGNSPKVAAEQREERRRALIESGQARVVGG